MLLISLLILVSIILLLILTLTSFLISEGTLFSSREELSSYECGFEHHSLSRLPLSLRYFMLTLIFLIFDMEIMFVVYYPLITSTSMLSQLIFMFFISLLFLMLIFEWLDGSLDWVM